MSGVSIEQAAIQVVDQWKLGDKQRDDGVLILVAKQERKIRIEVGQGLEGLLPDVVTKRIISDVMVPVFRQSSPSQGIVVGAYQVLLAIDPNFKAMEAAHPESFEPDSRSLFQKYEGIFILLFIGFIFLLNLFGPRGQEVVFDVESAVGAVPEGLADLAWAAVAAEVGLAAAADSVEEVPVEVGNFPSWARSVLKPEDLPKISEAVRRAEMKTTGEIVPVIVHRSSVVGHVPLMFTLVF